MWTAREGPWESCRCRPRRRPAKGGAVVHVIGDGLRGFSPASSCFRCSDRRVVPDRGDRAGGRRGTRSLGTRIRSVERRGPAPVPRGSQRVEPPGARRARIAGNAAGPDDGGSGRCNGSPRSCGGSGAGCPAIPTTTPPRRSHRRSRRLGPTAQVVVAPGRTARTPPTRGRTTLDVGLRWEHHRTSATRTPSTFLGET